MKTIVVKIEMSDDDARKLEEATEDFWQNYGEDEVPEDKKEEFGVSAAVGRGLQNFIATWGSESYVDPITKDLEVKMDHIEITIVK